LGILANKSLIFASNMVMENKKLNKSLRLIFLLVMVFIVCILASMLFSFSRIKKSTEKNTQVVENLARVEELQKQIYYVENEINRSEIDDVSPSIVKFSEQVEELKLRNIYDDSTYKTFTQFEKYAKQYISILQQANALKMGGKIELAQNTLNSEVAKQSRYAITTSTQRLELTQNKILGDFNKLRYKNFSYFTIFIFVFGLAFLCICYWAYLRLKNSFALIENKNDELQLSSTILQNINAAVITTSTNGNILSWNTQAEGLFGFSKTEVQNKPISDFFVPNENTQVPSDVEAKTKDGSQLYLQIKHNSFNTQGQQQQVYIINDITQRVKLENQIKSTSEKLKQDLNSFFERINDAFFLLDNNWNYAYVNKKSAELHGVTEDELIGENIWEQNPELVGESFYEALVKAKKEQISIRSKFYYAKQNRWFENFIYGNNDGVSVYYNDITESMRRELATKEANNRLSFHLTNTPLAVLEFDKNLRIVEWSRNAEKLFGYAAEDIALQGLKLDTLLHPDDRATFNESVSLIAMGDNTKNMLTSRGITKRGETIYLQWYNSFLAGAKNEKGVMLAFVNDITAAKKTENELIFAEAKFRNLVEDSPVGVYIRKGEKFIYVNPSFEQIFGFTSSELYDNVTIQNLIAEEDKERIIQQRLASKENNLKSINYKFKGITKNGETVYAEVFGSTTVLNNEEVVIGTVVDVTAKEEAEIKLNEVEQNIRISNERFELVSKATQDGIWDFDITKDEITGNESFMANYGLTINDKIKFADFIRRVRPEEKRQILWNNYLSAVALKENIVAEEFDFYCEDGTLKTMYDRAYVMYNSEGIPYRMLGGMQDITAIKKVQQDLQKEKELSESIIKLLPINFYIFNEQRQFLFWNENFRKFTGFTNQELSTKTPRDIAPEKIWPVLDEFIKTILEKGSVSGEADFYQEKGTKVVPFYVSGTNINYKGQNCIMGIGVDISEKIAYEHAIKKSEEKYKLFFEENPLPMWIISTDGKMLIQNVNKSAIDFYGYSRDEFLKMKADDLHVENDASLEKYKFLSDKEKENHQQIWKHVKKDGTAITVKLYRKPIMLDGELALAVLANDITEQIKAENALLKAYEDYKELATKVETIREQERTHMAREIHDELGQQLTGLKMDITWINRKIKTEDAALQERINDTVSLIDKTVITVRRLSSELRPSILDDLGLVAAMDWQNEEFMRRSEIKAVFTSSAPAIQVNSEIATALFRIFQECLTNVMRHAKATEVNTNISVDNNVVRLEVADNGIGFDEALVKDKKTLGLLGMQERVALINGTCQIKGNKNSGTSVIITVPL
jgi:PAS domain S-box-containing protein